MHSIKSYNNDLYNRTTDKTYKDMNHCGTHDTIIESNYISEVRNNNTDKKETNRNTSDINDDNYVPITIFDEQLLFTQLGITLYQNNLYFRDVQICKLRNDIQSSIFVHISTNKRYANHIETEEFRKSLESIQTAIFQNEHVVAVALHPKSLINDDMYHLYEYPVGEELLLFNSTLSKDMSCYENSNSIVSNISISLEEFDIPEDWDTCTETTAYDENRYWCMFPVHCNRYTKTNEDKIRRLFYSVLDERFKDILNKDPNVCYRVIFQHPSLQNYIKEPRIYIMEVNQIHFAESVEEHTYIRRIPRDTCHVIDYVHNLPSNNTIRNTLMVPKYLGESKFLLPAWEKSICQPSHLYGIQVFKGAYHQMMYNPFHVLQKYTCRSAHYLSDKCKKLQHWFKCMTMQPSVKKSIAL